MLNGFVIKDRVSPSIEGIQALTGLPTSIGCDVTGRMVGAEGLHPVNKSSVSACGNAVTVKVRSGDNLMIHLALRMLQPGDVLVVDAEGDLSRALFGEIMMSVAKSKGAVAAVINGAIRDVDAFEEAKFPCWAKGVNLRGPYKEGPGSLNVPVTIGGMLIHPGDIVLGGAYPGYRTFSSCIPNNSIVYYCINNTAPGICNLICATLLASSETFSNRK